MSQCVKPDPRKISGASCVLCGHEYPEMTGIELVEAHAIHCVEYHVGQGSVRVRVRVPAKRER